MMWTPVIIPPALTPVLRCAQPTGPAFRHHHRGAHALVAGGAEQSWDARIILHGIIAADPGLQSDGNHTRPQSRRSSRHNIVIMTQTSQTHVAAARSGTCANALRLWACGCIWYRNSFPGRPRLTPFERPSTCVTDITIPAQHLRPTGPPPCVLQWRHVMIQLWILIYTGSVTQHCDRRR